MKKLGEIFLIFLIFLSCLLAEAKYINQPNFNVYFKNSRLVFESVPVTIEGVLYVPIRDIAKHMGLELIYNNRQDYYEIKRPADFRTIIFKLHSTKIRINNQEDKLTYPVQLIKNRYYVPLNDFLWTLGYFVKIEGNKFFILTKIKDISWQNQTLNIAGEAPLECSLATQLSGVEITIFNAILGRHADELELEDGGIKKISYYQESLQPARIKIIITTIGRLAYTAFQEDSDNSFLVKFKYQPLAKVNVPKPVHAVKTELQISALPEATITSTKISTGTKLFASNTALWLPEKMILMNNYANFVIAGSTYLNVPIKNYKGLIYVPFDTIFTVLNCNLEQNIFYDSLAQKYQIINNTIQGPGVSEAYSILHLEKTYVPLVQTLRIAGYGAYFNSNKIYINPRISEMSYIQDNQGTRLIIKANARLFPKTITYLKNPLRCLIDIPNAAYDAPINILRPVDSFCSQIRAAQFDRGIVRVVMELKDTKIKPELSYQEKNLALAVLINNKSVQVASADKVIAQNIFPQEKERKIKVEADEVVQVEQVYSLDIQQPKVQTINLIGDKGPEIKITSSSEVIAIKPVDGKKPEIKLMKGLKVVIIPGHGGEDVGAISRSGYMEKIPTLEVAQKLAKLLRDNGAIALLCREDDRNVSLDEQAEFALKNNADLLISIHFNAFTDDKVGGAESYYYKDMDYNLAKAVHEEIIKTTAIKNKGLKKAQMHNLNHTTMPGVLIEPAFISNRREELLIRSDIYQWKLARAIYRGIEQYIKNK